MQFSMAWLRELCATDAPVGRVAELLTARGLTAESVQACGPDHSLDLDIPANRPDCLGHRGVARELAAALGLPQTPGPSWTPPVDESEADAAHTIRVEIQAPADCRRFTARVVRGVRVAPSPAWVVQRLEACGLRSINNVVDASNLVMLGTGNPVHFFDLRQITDGCIHVRRARQGETLTTLDDVQRDLTPEMLLVADPRRPLGLAGIMGGADSEIDDTTRDVLIEAAAFASASIRANARRLGLHTDASQRFERGVDPEGVVPAQALAAWLLSQLAGGVPDRGMIDLYPGKAPAPTRVLRLPRLGRLLGYQPGRDETISALTALELEPNDLGDGSIRITVPSWRVDLEYEADLVEEVARHLGYDRIPAVATALVDGGGSEAAASMEERARDELAHAGFHEAYGYAMLAAREDAPFVEPDAAPPLRLANPISETMAYLRRSILPALVKAADLNLRRGVKNVRLFEVERAFLGDPGGGGRPREPGRVGLAWSGAAVAPHWSQPDREVDVFDVAGIVERLLERLRPGLHSQRTRFERDAFHPRRSMCWKLSSGAAVAWCGQLHPRLALELPQPLYLGVVDLDALGQMTVATPHYRALPRLGPVTRDLAVVLPEGNTYAEVLQTLNTIDPPVRVRIDAVDRYQGPPLPAGSASLTLRVTLQPDDRSLTEEQIEGYRSRLVQALEQKLGLKIRA